MAFPKTPPRNYTVGSSATKTTTAPPRYSAAAALPSGGVLSLTPPPMYSSTTRRQVDEESTLASPISRPRDEQRIVDALEGFSFSSNETSTDSSDVKFPRPLIDTATDSTFSTPPRMRFASATGVNESTPQIESSYFGDYDGMLEYMDNRFAAPAIATILLRSQRAALYGDGQEDPTTDESYLVDYQKVLDWLNNNSDRAKRAITSTLSNNSAPGIEDDMSRTRRYVKIRRDLAAIAHSVLSGN